MSRHFVQAESTVEVLGKGTLTADRSVPVRAPTPIPQPTPPNTPQPPLAQTTKRTRAPLADITEDQVNLIIDAADQVLAENVKKSQTSQPTTTKKSKYPPPAPEESDDDVKPTVRAARSTRFGPRR